jgi:RNAse (barnase) inhibitor barstar
VSSSPVSPIPPDLTSAAPSGLRSVHFAEQAPDAAQAEAAGIRVAELDAIAIEDKQGLLAAISAAFEFPDYFGGNWDALEECLRDLGTWLQAEGYALVIAHGEDLWKRDAKLAGMLVKVWSAAAGAWVERGVPFHLVFVR